MPTSRKSAKPRGITFIGPKPEVIRTMGLKQLARAAMKAQACRSCPDRKASSKSPKKRSNWPRRSAIPVIIKASAGGGGRGMRVVRDAIGTGIESRAGADRSGRGVLARPMSTSRSSSKRRATSSFRCWRPARQRGSSGRARMLHPAPASEADRGSAFARGQPGTARSNDRRRCAKRCAAVGYTNAGTVEFLMDEKGNLYFIEVNARIQVEHPVTEVITGIDLVKARSGLPPATRLTDILPQPITIRGPCHRMPHQRRASGDVRPVARQDHRPEPARRHRRSRRHGGVHRWRRPALLRFAGREADRPRRRSRRSDRPHAARARICSSWREFIRRFRCINASCADPRFIAGDLTTHFLNSYFKK